MKGLVLILCISQLCFSYSEAHNQFLALKVCGTGMILSVGSVLSESLLLKDGPTETGGSIRQEGENQVFGLLDKLTGLLGGLLGGGKGSRSIGDTAANLTDSVVASLPVPLPLPAASTGKAA